MIRTLGQDREDDTAYVFTSKNQKLVKIIRHEHNECQLYIQRFDTNMSFVNQIYQIMAERIDIEHMIMRTNAEITNQSDFAITPKPQ